MMGLRLMAGMFMVMGAVVARMVMIVCLGRCAMRVLVNMFMRVLMRMSMRVFVIVRLAVVRMLVRMRMIVVMRMHMLVFVLPFHK